MSSNVAIRVENLGKHYYTPQRNFAGKNPFVRHLKNMGLWSRKKEEYFWALRDVSFEVKQGEILGIMGQNGSGKSTLLKILSGVTPPSTGRVAINGKIGSLLEVGTGFHPDMSGRENIYMNGVLLGISKAEIRAKFDELVDFAGIEDFIDVPVKRYSSGMYVRLAYAVTSMLRTDILILDEVLAVGDASFQEKARKNMRQVADEGRTILFVSHNARIVASLCDSGVYLDHGHVKAIGPIRDISSMYLSEIFSLQSSKQLAPECELTNAHRLEGQATQKVFEKIALYDKHGSPCTQFQTGKPFTAKIWLNNVDVGMPFCSLYIINEYGEYCAALYTTHEDDPISFSENCILTCTVDNLLLGEGQYYILTDFGRWSGVEDSHQSLDSIPNAIQFTVSCGDYVCLPKPASYFGAVLKSSWKAIRDTRCNTL